MPINFYSINKASSKEVKDVLYRYNLKGVNKPKKTPYHTLKSHLVLAGKNGKYKLIRFGQQGVKGITAFPKNKQKKARENFQKRHKKNIQKGIFYPGYWANKVKW